MFYNSLETLTKNKLGTGISVSSYNSDSNKYVFPSDGYLFVRISQGTSNFATVTLNDNGCTINATSAHSGGIVIFVKKGMNFYFNGTAGESGSQFIPLE